MIRTFRPWQVFEHLNGNNRLDLIIPTVPGTESRTVFMLDTALLIAAARITASKSILEIGTCMGYTAMHLAMNTEADITAIDSDPKPPVWRDKDVHSKIYLFRGTAQHYHIQAIANEYAPQFDMVFIDADHSYDAVREDTKTAVLLNPKVISWHDYTNPSEPGVRRFVDEFAGDHSIIHVQDSWLAFWFREDLNG